MRADQNLRPMHYRTVPSPLARPRRSVEVEMPGVGACLLGVLAAWWSIQKTIARPRRGAPALQTRESLQRSGQTLNGRAVKALPYTPVANSEAFRDRRTVRPAMRR